MLIFPPQTWLWLTLPKTCITTLALRNLVRPFRQGMLQQACSMSEIFRDLTDSLAELQTYREANEIDLAPS